MSLLFFKRLLANPVRVGYLVPSSGFLTRKTAKRIDFSKPRTVVELGPGEGCHTREIVRRMNAESRLVLIELDDHFAAHLEKQFAHDERVTVVHTDALHLVEALEKLGVSNPDYIVSGIPFTIMDRDLARAAAGKHRPHDGAGEVIRHLPSLAATLRARAVQPFPQRALPLQCAAHHRDGAAQSAASVG